MKAFVTFLTASIFFLAATFVGTLTGRIPDPRALTWWLLMIALFTLGVKFVIADTLSSDGFRLSKASTDMCLMLLATLTSLSAAQTFSDKSIFSGPPTLFITGDPTATFSQSEVETSSWLLCGLSLMIFVICLSAAKWGRSVKPINALGVTKLIVSKLICATTGALPLVLI